MDRIVSKEVIIVVSYQFLQLSNLLNPSPIIILKDLDMIGPPSYGSDTVEVSGVTMPKLQLFCSGFLIPEQFFIGQHLFIKSPAWSREEQQS